ncbi:hypothetical protein J7J00_26150 [Bacillus sp. ISL-4]|uniref:hypothetical protein n=1 Tax=Bacillus sp. ISL-4 TaxID=2819125 RepID=UPI001BED34C0|nr:hypothetical protein [Bacillus sp. ISL-4]MBT2668886.1 hypothetical protein [Bacillus sp. ISL-4]
MKKKLSIFSISCFMVTILLFVLTLIIGHNKATSIPTSDFGNNGIFGYTIFGIMMIAPICGLILALIGEKGSLKMTGIIGNLVVFFSISLFIAGVAFYDTIDDKVVETNEKVDVEPEQKNQADDSTKQEDIATSETTRYPIYGGWMDDESYILIKSDGDGGEGRTKFILEKIPKKGKDKILFHFQLAESTGLKRTGIIVSKESNRTSFLTLELNKEITELTITLPNEKPVTYKMSEIEPQEFNPDYEWE